MTRFKACIISLCVFLGYCGQAFADTQPAASLAKADMWVEPRSCLQLDRSFDQMCMHSLYALAMRHLELKENDDAIARFSQILRMKQFAFVYANRAMAYSNKKQYPQALRDLRKAQDMMPTNTIILSNLAKVEQAMGLRIAALRHISAAIEIKGEEPEFYELRSQLYMELGDPVRAKFDADAAAAFKAKRTPTIEAVVREVPQ